MGHILKSGLVATAVLAGLLATEGVAAAQSGTEQVATIKDAGLVQESPGFWSRLLHGSAAAETATKYTADRPVPFAGGAPSTRQQMLFLSLHSLPVE